MKTVLWNLAAAVVAFGFLVLLYFLGIIAFERRWGVEVEMIIYYLQLPIVFSLFVLSNALCLPREANKRWLQVGLRAVVLTLVFFVIAGYPLSIVAFLYH